MDKIEIQSLRIKIDENTTLDLSMDKARKLRDALLEVFPTNRAPDTILIDRYRDFSRPYYPSWTTGANTGSGDPTVSPLCCDVEA